jgi:hypothetical protein
LRHTVYNVEAHTNIFTAQKRDLHSRGATPVEPGPAIHQADALQFELRRTLIWATPHPIQQHFTTSHPKELRRTLLSYAAKPPTFKLRRTLLSYAATATHLSYAAPW